MYIYINHDFLAKIPEGRSCKGRPEVGDDSIGHTEAMCYLLDEFRRFFQRYLSDKSDFNPLGEFVDGHKDVLIAARGGSEQSYGIKAPHGKGPRWGYRAQDLSRQVLLFGKELTSLAPLYEVFGISHGRGPVEAKSVGLADQIGRCWVAATLTAMDLSQELKTF
jgi:hypothetical protein